MKKILLTTMVCVSIFAHAESTTSFDLDAIYSAAKEHDPVFAGARAAAIAGAEKTEQGLALWRPQLRATLDYSNQDGEQVFANGISNRYQGSSTGYGVYLTQSVLNAEADVRKRQLKEEGRLSELNWSSSKQLLILRTTRAYFDVLFAQDNLQFVRAQKDAVARQLAQSKASFESGSATITDVHEAQAAFDGVLASEIAALNSLDSAKGRLLQLTKLPAIDGLASLRSTDSFSVFDVNGIATWVEKVTQSNLEIEEHRIGQNIANFEVEKYRTENQLTVSLVGSYTGLSNASGMTSKFGGVERTNGATVGFQVNIPIYTGGSTSSKLRERAALAEQAQADVEATHRDVEQKARSTYLAINAAAAQVHALEQALVSAKALLDSTRVGQEIGSRTTLDVLNAEQRMYATLRDLSLARYTYVLKRVDLYALAGELSESHLHEINAQLTKQ